MTRHHTPRRTFREGHRMWSVFVGVCARQGTTATAVLKQSIRDYLRTAGWTDEELAGLAAADERDLNNEPHPREAVRT